MHFTHAALYISQRGGGNFEQVNFAVKFFRNVIQKRVCKTKKGTVTTHKRTLVSAP